MTLNVLHTSDWHLGRSLYGQRRYEEFDAFLDWMLTTLREQQIDVLLIAGDIFDTTAPSNRAMQQYYDFLRRTADTQCRHIVIIGGNHDSPTFLNAPRELLKVLNVHVVGAKTDDPAEEVLCLDDTNGQPSLMVCAVPYLRDRDVRTAEAGETIDDKEQKLLEGIRDHYQAVTGAAEAQRARLETQHKSRIPMVGMGHLWTAGAVKVEGDGVRDLYVGSLAHVGTDIFPASLDYVALGHLHVPQPVGGKHHIRYSGSPLPMGFGEARQQKSVCVIAFDDGKATIEQVDIPCFQRLRQLSGSLATLQTELQALLREGESTWVEIVYTGQDIVPDLREKLLEALTEDKEGLITLLRVKNQRITAQTLQAQDTEQTLDDLSPQDVFQRCLDAHEVPDEQRPELLHLYQDVLTRVQESDGRAD
ncbi:MAG: exonuclease SbcCD subunit D C-terminal domain-containing protein [Pseudohongiella sp.]|uniref:exonuclease SbcCD subunit D C-terminal domain-containing protein n=1 Tax=Pseudohongiella sp. TaxID=1979412 RepID=UPI0034A01390